MNVFIDTAAFLAILDADDNNHEKAKAEWIRIINSGDNLYTNNYILVETFGLIQHRLGMKAVMAFEKDILPMVSIEWVKESTHKAGISAFLAALKRRLSASIRKYDHVSSCCELK